MPVLPWLLRPVLFLAAIIAGWFVAEDAANFSVVQMVVAVFLITAAVVVAAFWEALVEKLRARGGR